LLATRDLIAIAPQVLAEFIHVATDPRRFAQPLDMTAARQIAEQASLAVAAWASSTRPASRGSSGWWRSR